MPRYDVCWDEVVTYCVEVEAPNEASARIAWCDPAHWDSEPEVICSDFTNDVTIEEIG